MVFFVVVLSSNYYHLEIIIKSVTLCIVIFDLVFKFKTVIKDILACNVSIDKLL